MDKRIELGDVAKDTITGFQGVVVGRTLWLHGCDRLIIQPQALHDGQPIESKSFDEPQLALVSRKAVAVSTLHGLQKTGGPRPEPSRGR